MTRRHAWALLAVAVALVILSGFEPGDAGWVLLLLGLVVALLAGAWLVEGP